MPSYQIKFEPKAKREFKKLDPQLLRSLDEEHLPKIAANPQDVSKRLSGNLRNLWSYHFYFFGTQYRIVYKIIKQEIVIVIIAIGKREKFYARLQRRI